MASYMQPGLILRAGAGASDQVKEMQRDLRRLGYLRSGVDGVFGGGTETAIRVLQYDLMSNDGKSRGGDGDAPVRMIDYNRGRVAGISGTLEQPLAACMAEMLEDARFPKLPASANPSADNARAIAAVRAIDPPRVPLPFLLAILTQESGLRHFSVPDGENEDNFIVTGLDTNAGASHIVTSRGYGIGQYTIFHHPPRPEEIVDFMLDPVRNVGRAVRELIDKFDKFVVGGDSGARADDRIGDAHGNAPLRICKYGPTDKANYLRACRGCMQAAGVEDIVAGRTPLYAGAAATYEATQYHPNANYRGVPVRAKIPCDWPYAARRYNGSGVNSYDYQAEVLSRILKTDG